MALTGAQLLLWAVGALSLEFPASFADKAAIAARQTAWRELLEAHPWVTEDVFRRAVHSVRWKHPGPFLPPAAVFLDYCQAAADELEREARGRHRRLPPPAPPTDDERRAADDRVEAAKLRARLSLPERLRGKHTPRKGR